MFDLQLNMINLCVLPKTNIPWQLMCSRIIQIMNIMMA